MATTNPASLPGEPVDPSQAQGAQIPLRTFTIPDFPASAGGLKALTLTSDIKVDEYAAELARPHHVPARLPAGIESLTLELFSLGYPAGFLAALADALPHLKSVVLYSQLFAGLTAASQRDAVAFFRKLPGLRALHLLDVFAQPGFFVAAAPWLRHNTSDAPGAARRGLMFLEVSYAFRHEDEEFMAKIQATELPALVGPGLISCSFNLAPPEQSGDDEQDPATIRAAGGKEGIMAFNQTLAAGLVEALTGDETAPRGLRALNTTLYTFASAQLARVLAAQRHVMILNVTAEVEPGEAYKRALITSLEQCQDLEQVEVVGNPSLQFFMEVQNPRTGTLGKTFPSAGDMAALSSKCGKLASLKANVLRTTSFGTVEWERKDGEWKGGVKDATGVTGQQT